MHDERAKALAEKAIENVAKWGRQDKSILALAMAEEMGEVARAVLKYKHADQMWRIYQEAIDLGALCLQMMQEVDECAREKS